MDIDWLRSGIADTEMEEQRINRRLGYSEDHLRGTLSLSMRWAVAQELVDEIDRLRARVAELEENQRFAFCAYCGYRTALDDPNSASAEIIKHTMKCAKHPLRAATELLERAEARVAELEEALGLLTTAVPSMEMDSADPVGMARRVCDRVAELKRRNYALAGTIERVLETTKVSQRTYEMMMDVLGREVG